MCVVLLTPVCGLVEVYVETWQNRNRALVSTCWAQPLQHVYLELLDRILLEFAQPVDCRGCLHCLESVCTCVSQRAVHDDRHQFNICAAAYAALQVSYFSALVFAVACRIGTSRAPAQHLVRASTRAWTGCQPTLPARAKQRRSQRGTALPPSMHGGCRCLSKGGRECAIG